MVCPIIKRCCTLRAYVFSLLYSIMKHISALQSAKITGGSASAELVGLLYHYNCKEAALHVIEEATK